jgi:MFS superfamily sulfate permease-like transporter
MQHLTGDIVGGLSVGVLLIAQSVAHASIATVKPVNGVYCGFVPLIVYAIFATSKHLAVGTGALVALIVATEVAEYEDLEERTRVAIAIGFIAGIIQLFLGMLSMGSIVCFISRPALSGFITGGACHIVGGQFKNLVGIHLERSDYLWQQLFRLAKAYKSIDLCSTFVGGACLLVLIILKKLKKTLKAKAAAAKKSKQPTSTCDTLLLLVCDFNSLVVVIGSTIAACILHRHGYTQVEILGELPTGFPTLDMPITNLPESATLKKLLASGAATGIVSFIASIGVAQKVALAKGYEIEPNTEFVALGLAGALGSLFGAFPLQGSLSRTAVSAQSGGNTQLAFLISASVIALGLLVLMPLLHFLPKVR